MNNFIPSPSPISKCVPELNSTLNHALLCWQAQATETTKQEGEQFYLYLERLFGHPHDNDTSVDMQAAMYAYTKMLKHILDGPISA